MSGSVKTTSAPVAEPAAPAPKAPPAPAALGGLQALAGSSANATIARAVAPGGGASFAVPRPITSASGLAISRDNGSSTASPPAQGESAAKKALEDPIDFGLGILDKTVGGQLKNGKSKEWESRKNWGGDTWRLPQIDIPLVKVIQVYVGGSATAHAGIGARGKVEAKREEQGSDSIKDTLTITGKANVTGGIEGSLKAGVSVGMPKIAQIKAGVSGSMKLDGKGTMDVDATLTRSGKVGSLGKWSAKGGYSANISGALTAQLKGEITWQVLWWDGTIASFNIANWNLGKAGVTIKGDISTEGKPQPPKVSWTFNPPTKPPLQKSGNMNPKQKPAEGAPVARKVPASAGDDGSASDSGAGGPVLARQTDDPAQQGAPAPAAAAPTAAGGAPAADGAAASPAGGVEQEHTGDGAGEGTTVTPDGDVEAPIPGEPAEPEMP